MNFKNYYDDEDEIEQIRKDRKSKDVRSKGDFEVRGGKMLFQRVGPINSQKQVNNKRAPESRGVWAFPIPYLTNFLLAANFPLLPRCLRKILMKGD